MPSETICADASPLPDAIETETELDELLTRPGAALTAFIRTLPGPLLVLGAGGKMGPSLAVLAKRAAAAAGHKLDVIAASRFSDAGARHWLEERGVKTIACDLLDRGAVERLPNAANIIYLVGQKFGTQSDPATTWAMNVLAPAHVAERFPRARIVALSTGNVYPPCEPAGGGAMETDPLTPVGEYANSAVGRERVFEYFARRDGVRVAMLRLFYAVELRYGALVDIAQRVFAGEPIDLGNAHFNCIWQGDANEMILRALDLAASPMAAFNLCRPETFSVRETALRFGAIMGREPRFTGAEGAQALLGNSARLCEALGAPRVDAARMICWIAGWVAAGGRNLGKPTHFETRDGKY
jgi:nucleoside-diphosphate-sugar epimerase